MKMLGRGISAPQVEGSSYVSTDDGEVYGQRIEDNQFAYPYAWNLTAVVGPDYIDFDDIPGPSDGDLGYWVKFKYVKTSDNYTWRAPFSGLSQRIGNRAIYSDDYYSMRGGKKEIYYLHQYNSHLEQVTSESHS